MKKVLIGCGVAFLLFTLLAVGATLYVGVKLKNWTESVEASGKKVEAVSQKFPFTPPDTPALSPERYEVYAQARRNILDRIAKDEALGKLLALMNTPQGQTPQGNPLPAMFGMFGAIPRLLDAMSEELERAKMGLEEFQYHTRLVWLSMAEVERSGEASDEAKAMFDRIHQALAGMNNQNKTVTGNEIQGLALQLPRMTGVDQAAAGNMRLIIRNAADYRTMEAILMDIIMATSDFRSGQFGFNQQGGFQIQPGPAVETGE